MKLKLAAISSVVLFIMLSCHQNIKSQNPNWIVLEEEYEGFPLYLRYPDFQNVWSYSKNYQKLARLNHTLESVKDNGLPTSEYNISLMGFDEDVINLVDLNKNGIVVLIETYGGSRTYWFYVSNSDFITENFNKLKSKYPKMDMTFDCDSDEKWGFIREYPYELYKPE